MFTPPAQKPPNYFRVAWQSALAAGLCLGLPAGLLFWLILFREVNHSASVDRIVATLQANGLSGIIVLAACSLLWSFLLGKISNYRLWWRIGGATILGVFTGWFSPLSNLDGWFGARLPVYVLHAIFMIGVISSVTICVGLAYGLLLKSVKAALGLALRTSIASILTALITIIVMDQAGIRVGSGDFAMAKVTGACLLTSAMMAGTVLGLGFSRFVRTAEHQDSPPS